MTCVVVRFEKPKKSLSRRKNQKNTLKKGAFQKDTTLAIVIFQGAKLWVFRWTPKAGGAANPMAAMMNDPAAMQAGNIHEVGFFSVKFQQSSMSLVI